MARPVKRSVHIFSMEATSSSDEGESLPASSPFSHVEGIVGTTPSNNDESPTKKQKTQEEDLLICEEQLSEEDESEESVQQKPPAEKGDKAETPKESRVDKASPPEAPKDRSLPEVLGHIPEIQQSQKPSSPSPPKKAATPSIPPFAIAASSAAKETPASPPASPPPPPPPPASSPLATAADVPPAAAPAAPASEPASPNESDTEDIQSEVISTHVHLYDLPKKTVSPSQGKPNPAQLRGLEKALMFEQDEEWPNEWSGNLELLTREVDYPSNKKGKSEKDRLPLCEWASTNNYCLELARGLLRHVFFAETTPPTAKRILAHAHAQSGRNSKYDLMAAVRRLSYDPVVLREDGWTTAKAKEPTGASGGPFHIGASVFWDGYVGIVIAYVHDHDMGDLWKAMWLEGNETFDMEPQELQKAMKAHRRKFAKKEPPLESRRFAHAERFAVKGIKYGIVMAKTYNPQARQGLFWPARVMHVSEAAPSPERRRSSSKQMLTVMFLAPYWNAASAATATFDSLSQGSPWGPLFEMETINVSEDTLQEYPYDGEEGLDMEAMRVAFRFTGLPKNAFWRFLDSHRLALALKTYAQQELKSDSTHSHSASAALADTHAMAVETAKFPLSVLHLPFAYILSQLPRNNEKNSLTIDSATDDDVEPVVQIRQILLSMQPPAVWGKEPVTNGNALSTPTNGQRMLSALSSPYGSPTPRRNIFAEETLSGKEKSPAIKLHEIASDNFISSLSKLSSTASMTAKLLDQLAYLLSRLRQDVAASANLGVTKRRKKLLSFLKVCLRIKSQGEDTICSEEYPTGIHAKSLLMDWRKACENMYKQASVQLSCSKFGNAVTFVISDGKCNEHLTSDGCVERCVRLPAALKGARLAGAGSSDTIQLMPSVGDDYTKLAETKVIGMAHSESYLKRMRLKCTGINPGTRGVPLTEASDGEGGQDTKGSRGSYSAAVAGVAAAIKAVDMIVGGQCVNAFCATRPPGHHAGRELHPMKASSNGFCILNNAACAALYATTPISEQGLGLKRVCVIDIDVHHGNGTQDILCQTYDPRFLYVSMHAGGAHINGTDTEDDIFGAHSRRIEDGIYPGRCGDTSPHKGVLNIPLGARVTAQNVGNALVSLVGPAVFSFAPDLIILSAGFDAHKNDPLGMGGLSAADFGHITDVACSMAFKSCSGRVLSILEGGYGIPCCRPQKDLFLPKNGKSEQGQQPKLVNLGSDLPKDMDDQIPAGMRKKLDRCHAEGFIECVQEHVETLAKCNNRSKQ